jgi:hypothetical protein
MLAQLINKNIITNNNNRWSSRKRTLGWFQIMVENGVTMQIGFVDTLQINIRVAATLT